MKIILALSSKVAILLLKIKKELKRKIMKMKINHIPEHIEIPEPIGKGVV